MNDTQEAAEDNAVPRDPVMAAPDPAMFASLTRDGEQDPERSPELGVVQAVRRLPGPVRAVAGNRRGAR